MEAIKLSRLDTPIIFIEARINLSRFVVTGCAAKTDRESDGVPVFLKRLPLTDVEVEHPGSTRNWFKLPTYYSYGVGSAGFGSWREVVAHRVTTGVPGFPELLHDRVMPRTALPRQDLPWTPGG